MVGWRAAEADTEYEVTVVVVAPAPAYTLISQLIWWEDAATASLR